MPGKYTPLEHHLAALPPGQSEVTLTFAQIERILHAKLPPSAHNHLAWWANDRDGRHLHANAWMNAGWLVESFNQPEKWVRFRRTA